MNNITLYKNDSETEFSGYASVFGNIDAQGDRILPGAYSESIKKHKSSSLIEGWLIYWQHNVTHPPIGYLTDMKEDNIGLKVFMKFHKEFMGGNLSEISKLGISMPLSVGIQVKESYFDDQSRVIVSADLVEVSVVTNPANIKAKINFHEEEKCLRI